MMTKRKIAKKSAGRSEFSNEADVRAAVGAVRDAYPTLDGAEASDEWKKLRPAIAKWIWAAASKPRTSDPDWGNKLARIYLRSPRLLPALPPRHEPISGSEISG
jgi:hypothetical protein